MTEAGFCMEYDETLHENANKPCLHLHVKAVNNGCTLGKFVVFRGPELNQI
jgi:hypothetical protein